MPLETFDGPFVTTLGDMGSVLPVIAQSGGMDAGTIALIVVVLLALISVVVVVMGRGGEAEEAPEPKARRDVGAPTKDVLEDRIEVEEPVEITDDMSLAEIKRAKRARVRRKSGAEGRRRETAVEATERAKREIEEPVEEEAAVEPVEEGQEQAGDDAEAATSEAGLELEPEPAEVEAAEPDAAEARAQEGETETSQEKREENGAAEEPSAPEKEEPRLSIQAPRKDKTTSKSGLFRLPKPAAEKPKAQADGTRLPRPSLKLPKISEVKKTADTEEKQARGATEEAEAAADERDVTPPEEEVVTEEDAAQAAASTDTESSREALAVEGEEVEEEAEAASTSPGSSREEISAAEKGVEEEAEAAARPKPRRGPTSLEEGLEKTRSGFISKLSSIFSGEELDEDMLEDIEEVLFTADIGPYVAQDIIDSVEEQLNADEKQDPGRVWAHVRDYAEELLRAHESPLDVESAEPFVILVVGVNGAGKTTTIGKMASKFRRAGKSVLLVAGDTFRAGAVDQLNIWAERADFPIYEGDEGADPSSVVFDGIKKGVGDEVDVVICDTSGRLHTNANLMDELEKMGRVAGKALEGAPHETILVLDANTGQNAIVQAEKFAEVLKITGLALTKLDGTAKGGVILGICRRLEAPVRYIGIGEDIDDLREFNAAEFVEALFM